MKTASFFLLFSLSFLIEQCDKATTNTPINEAIIFQIKERKTIGDSGIQLQFAELVEDSRCPVDADCFWAGQASVQLLATEAGSDYEIKLTLRGDGRHQGANIFVFKGYQLELLKVTPYPTGGTEALPDPAATIRITTKEEE